MGKHPFAIGSPL